MNLTIILKMMYCKDGRNIIIPAVILRCMLANAN